MNTKFKKVASVFAAGVIAVGLVGALSACGGGKTDEPEQPAVHQHAYVEHAAMEATCEVDGHEAYFTCAGCEKYFDTDKHEIALADVATTPALGHVRVKVDATYATTTHGGYSQHYECTRDRCGQWFYADGDSYKTYPSWCQINDGVAGIWDVTEASVEINQSGSGTVGSTITMTETEYAAGAGTELDRQNFWDNIFESGNESIVFIQNGTCEGRRWGATWVQDGDTITVTLANDKGTEIYTIREDGSLTRTRRTAGGDVITYILYKGSNPL